ncbi:MAG: hypothetical protein M1819_000860 [Sarea resinae]|nr:MAG: hypothetical protein M1819_000860 [Sarea resinae]
MVCAKCARLTGPTNLATPAPKRKNELYHGSPSSSASSKKTTSATQGQNGIGKSKLLSKNAKNPYAQYASNCTTCKTKTEKGWSYCLRCAYKANACAMCGKGLKKKEKKVEGDGGQEVAIEGRRFSAK